MLNSSVFKYSSIVQIGRRDKVEGVSIWEVLGLDLDSFVHEVRNFDRHLPACGKVNQSEAIFNCTLMQAVLVYCWLMNGFPGAGCVCPLQLFIKLILGLLF
jgi:hypothetical protein